VGYFEGEAFRWTQSGGMVSLGDIPGGADLSIAEAASPHGSVIVGIGNGTSADQVEAFRWTAASGPVSLGDLPGGRTTARGYAVSADGSVVVGEGSSSNGTEAFRWTLAGGMQGLGDLPGGNFVSTALSVSADGSVVSGWSTSSASQADAYIWDAQHGMRSIKSILTNDFGLNLSGWTLELAFVSADGTTLAGHGINPQGYRQGWIATVPEPTSATFLATAIGALTLKRKRAS
jgi:probable HAF family extracellular repeat protein